jgi:DNA repair exonuclease SbcCD ATPase subunit
LPSLANDRTKAVQAHLKTLQAGALSEDKKRFQDRIQEVENAMKDNTIKNLEKDLEKYKKEFNQLNMFRSEQEERKIKEMIGGVEEEINRRTNHYKDLSKHLEEEQKRMIEHMLPKRYTLRDQVQVFPVAVEIRLQENPR